MGSNFRLMIPNFLLILMWLIVSPYTHQSVYHLYDYHTESQSDFHCLPTIHKPFMTIYHSIIHNITSYIITSNYSNNLYSNLPNYPNKIYIYMNKFIPQQHLLVTPNLGSSVTIPSIQTVPWRRWSCVGALHRGTSSPKPNRSFFLVGGKFHGVPSVNKHNYGKPPFWRGKSISGEVSAAMVR
jgi:hypothetical protein